MADEQKKLDETVEGGAYVKNGVVVDANGNPRAGWTVDESGTAVPPAVQKDEPASGGKGKE